MTVKSASLAPIGSDSGAGATVSCDSGEQVVAGGFNPDYPLVLFQSYPIDSGTWRFFFFNYTENSSPTTVIYAVCLK